LAGDVLLRVSGRLAPDEAETLKAEVLEGILGQVEKGPNSVPSGGAAGGEVL
jgi:hypothetical protein